MSHKKGVFLRDPVEQKKNNFSFRNCVSGVLIFYLSSNIFPSHPALREENERIKTKGCCFRSQTLTVPTPPLLPDYTHIKGGKENKYFIEFHHTYRRFCDRRSNSPPTFLNSRLPPYHRRFRNISQSFRTATSSTPFLHQTLYFLNCNSLSEPFRSLPSSP